MIVSFTQYKLCAFSFFFFFQFILPKKGQPFLYSISIIIDPFFGGDFQPEVPLHLPGVFGEIVESLSKL